MVQRVHMVKSSAQGWLSCDVLMDVSLPRECIDGVDVVRFLSVSFVVIGVIIWV